MMNFDKKGYQGRRRDAENPLQLTIEGFAILFLIAALGLSVDQYGKSLQRSASSNIEAPTVAGQ